MFMTKEKTEKTRTDHLGVLRSRDWRRSRTRTEDEDAGCRKKWQRKKTEAEGFLRWCNGRGPRLCRRRGCSSPCRYVVLLLCRLCRPLFSFFLLPLLLCWIVIQCSFVCAQFCPWCLYIFSWFYVVFDCFLSPMELTNVVMNTETYIRFYLYRLFHFFL